MPLHEYLARSAAADPDRVALQCGVDSRTYGELDQAARGLSAELLDSGLERGERVMIFLPNSIEAAISIFGVSAAGGCMVVVDPSTPAPRLRRLFEHSGARTVIAPADKLDMVRDVTAPSAQPARLLFVGEGDGTRLGTSFTDATRRPAPPARPSVATDDLAAIIYTSGSTGEPKGVTLSHGNIDGVTASVSTYLRSTSDDVVLSTLQLAFGYGLLQLLVSVLSRGRLILRTGFGFAYDVITTIAAEGVTGFAGVPTTFAMLLQIDDVGERLSSLRYVTNAAAAMPVSFIPRLQQLCPRAEIYLMYGQTECLRASYLPPDQISRRPASIGRGIPGAEVWLENEEGERPAPGEVGELMVSGPGVMLGYWNDPDATAAVVRTGQHLGHRVLRTRDLFTTDDEGYLYFVGRTDDMIKSRGQKVSPHEIEQLLYAHEAVLEARVIGVPDPVLGESIRAEIVPIPGAHLSAVGIKRYLRPLLEDYKVPQVVAFVDQLPKSTSGKIRRA